MPSATIRRPYFAGVVAFLIAGSWILASLPRLARADHQPPAESKTATAESASSERVIVPARGSTRKHSFGGGSAESSSGWWLGTVGIAVALAIFGGVSVASKRFLPQHGSGLLRVVGRTSLSPKHTVYLLKAGDRVLIVGTGPQGSPTLLGELDDPQEVERIAPSAQAVAPRVSLTPAGPRVGGFDRRVGDDE